jgi:hypothetical protein
MCDNSKIPNMIHFHTAYFSGTAPQVQKNFYLSCAFKLSC